MFSIQQLSERIAEVSANRLGVDDFEEWFVSASWGYYDVRGGQTSMAIAAVHHVLHSCEESHLQDAKVALELAKAIRPFECLSPNVVRIAQYKIPATVPMTAASSERFEGGDMPNGRYGTSTVPLVLLFMLDNREMSASDLDAF